MHGIALLCVAVHRSAIRRHPPIPPVLRNPRIVKSALAAQAVPPRPLAASEGSDDKQLDQAVPPRPLAASEGSNDKQLDQAVPPRPLAASEGSDGKQLGPAVPPRPLAASEGSDDTPLEQNAFGWAGGGAPVPTVDGRCRDRAAMAGGAPALTVQQPGRAEGSSRPAWTVRPRRCPRARRQEPRQCA